MLLAHAQKSGDGSLISEYYGTLKRYADTLVSETMTDSYVNILGAVRLFKCRCADGRLMVSTIHAARTLVSKASSG